jgi:hypothetical protein
MKVIAMRLKSGFCIGAVMCLTLPMASEGQDGKGKKDPKTGEFNTPAAKGERKDTKLRVGDLAPNFTLADLKKSKQVTLADFQGKKPVVLIFGSYT